MALWILLFALLPAVRGLEAGHDLQEIQEDQRHETEDTRGSSEKASSGDALLQGLFMSFQDQKETEDTSASTETASSEVVALQGPMSFQEEERRQETEGTSASSKTVSSEEAALQGLPMSFAEEDRRQDTEGTSVSSVKASSEDASLQGLPISFEEEVQQQDMEDTIASPEKALSENASLQGLPVSFDEEESSSNAMTGGLDGQSLEAISRHTVKELDATGNPGGWERGRNADDHGWHWPNYCMEFEDQESPPRCTKCSGGAVLYPFLFWRALGECIHPCVNCATGACYGKCSKCKPNHSKTWTYSSPVFFNLTRELNGEICLGIKEAPKEGLIDNRNHEHGFWSLNPFYDYNETDPKIPEGCEEYHRYYLWRHFVCRKCKKEWILVTDPMDTKDVKGGICYPRCFNCKPENKDAVCHGSSGKCLRCSPNFFKVNGICLGYQI